MTTLTLEISEQQLEDWQAKAARHNLSLDELINLAMQTLSDESYEDDLTEEELLANLRQGLHDALTGNYRPAREVLAELERGNDD